MPTSADIYQTLQEKYNQLAWYKKVGFWLTSPRLAWGLFGYGQRPNETRISQLIQLAKASWFFKTSFEKSVYRVFSERCNTGSNYNTPPPNTNSAVALGACADVIGVVGENLPPEDRANYGITSRIHRYAIFGTKGERQLKITRKLLSAVAYGMESKAVNVNPQPKDLFAEDLLKNSPEFLLERGDIKDWGGRTFKNITAFEYALWAKDFKIAC